jgi:ankyrin repeat protein
MPYTPDLLVLLHKTLATTKFCVDDWVGLGLGNWHASVLLDSTQYLSSLDPLTFNKRGLAGETPLDIAYRLNRVALIEKLEALGAVGDKHIQDWKGRGTFMPHDKYMHLPAKQGKIKTLESRFRLGGSLNDRDMDGNTPIHWLAIHGHFKAVRYFTDNYRMFELDMNAKNNEGNTARNLAILNGHHDVAGQLLIREIDNYISATRLWHEMSAGWTGKLPSRNA